MKQQPCRQDRIKKYMVLSNLEQCETCKHKGNRSCSYHGYYPDDAIPKSCSYKLGNNAEEAMRNLNGTFIDCWTPEHDNRTKKEVLDLVWRRSIAMMSNETLWDILEGIRDELHKEKQP